METSSHQAFSIEQTEMDKHLILLLFSLVLQVKI